MDIRYWRDSRGDSPVERSIDELDIKKQLKIVEKIDMVGSFGFATGPLVFKKMPGTIPSLHEIRINFRGLVRIYCFFDGHELWLLHMIHKKSPKAPKTDLNLAQARAKQIIQI